MTVGPLRVGDISLDPHPRFPLRLPTIFRVRGGGRIHAPRPFGSLVQSLHDVPHTTLAWPRVVGVVLDRIQRSGRGGRRCALLLRRADEELRHFVESRAKELYPELTIRIGSAKIVPGEGIRFGQLSFVQPQMPQADRRNELAYIETLSLRCDASISALLQGKLEIRHVIVDGLKLQLERERDGSWNASQLMPRELPPCRSSTLPQITVENAVVVLHDRTDGPNQILQAEELRLRCRLKRLTTTPARTELPDVLIAFDGQCRTSFCRRIQLEGVARTTDGAWTLRGNLLGAAWSADVARQLPTILSKQTDRFTPLRGRADVEFELGMKSRQKALDFQVKGQFREGSWQDAQLPQPISNLQFDFGLDRDGLWIERLQAYYGEALLKGDLVLSAYNLASPYRIRLTAERFPLTPRLVNLLPQSLRDAWAKFQAVGRISGQLELEFDGQRHDYTANLDCREFSLQHHKFPYPISDCGGEIKVSDNQVSFDLLGSAGGTPITLRGAIRAPGPRFTGWWEVKTTRWKTIDEDLIRALPPQATSFVQDLQLRGNVGFWVRYERDDPNLRPPPHVVVAIDQAWINYALFPYPIANVRGRLESQDGHWKFRELEGWNNGCRIRCDGQWWKEEPNAPLELDFALDNVSLDGELKQALSPAARELWAQLRPQGKLQHVDVRLYKTKEVASPELDIQLRQGPADQTSDRGEEVSLNPTWFPLQLANVRGEARLRGQSLVLRGLTAEHGKLTLRTNGTGEFRSSGSWIVNLTELTADRVQLDDALLRALPGQLGPRLRQLQVDGMFALSGAMQFARQSREAPVTSSWNARLDVEQGRLHSGMPLESIFGQVHFEGGSQGDRYWSRGDLRLDSVMSQRIQITNVAGPLWLDTDRVIFGQRVPPESADRVSAPVTASVYQGRLAGNAEVLFDADRSFSLQASLTEADMSVLARDWQLGRGNLAGRVMLELFLTGTARGRHTLKGSGTAQLRDANLYELPLILALLNRLGSGRRDGAAFSASDISFHVRDSYVYFDRFDLSGEAITLKGIGEMSLDRELSLDFYSIVGREQLWSPLVRPFLGEASRQFMQIHVDGTLSDPRTTQEVLPGLNETLQQLFPEQATDERPRQAAHPDLPRLGTFLGGRR